MIKRTLIFLAALLAAVAGLLVWIALQPPAARPNVTVALAGYTNDSMGSRWAMFTVSNASLSPIRRLSAYRIQIPISKRWTNISGGRFDSGTVRLPSGACETIRVVVPTNHASWRPWLVVSPEAGAVKETMNNVIIGAQSLGLPTRYRKVTYGAYSDWITE